MKGKSDTGRGGIESNRYAGSRCIDRAQLRREDHGPGTPS